ncbi:hypothetical protein FGU71_11110 [Erythrobacter insulae]|uniref:Uncharacterized protein n=1 Tax=Erythrobacter insulae TaxID=2584124 RepID=A0A547PE06_9SPHN|nr:hypothetical protein [Erythrobacter insulae]TRD12357.1 hypothetical protein FGU71_11110 [Erythrobacter insulae]
MLTNEMSVPCPDCGTAIPFTPQALINGESFSCPSCNASISLGDQSKDTVKAAMDKLDQLKGGAGG